MLLEVTLSAPEILPLVTDRLGLFLDFSQIFALTLPKLLNRAPQGLFDSHY